MNIWKGSILGTLNKHRDYEHGTYGAHLRADGAMMGFLTDEEGEYIEPIEYDEDELEEEMLEELRMEAGRMLGFYLTVNPITGLEFANPELYAALRVVLSSGEYDYYIPFTGHLPPPAGFVDSVLDEYTQNHVEDRYDLIMEHIDQGH